MGDRGGRLRHSVYKAEVKWLDLVLVGCTGVWEKVLTWRKRWRGGGASN